MHLHLDELRLRGGQRLVSTYPMDIAPLLSGGVSYDVVVPEGITVTIERIAGGYLLDVEITAKVCGPCSRCLAEVCAEVKAEQQEFIPTAVGGWPESDSSPFIADGVVDLSALSREAVVLAAPDRMLCSEQCKGLCPTCGADLNHSECSCGALEV